MNIAVCVKEIPNTEARLRIQADGRWIAEEDTVMNENDDFALEAALAVAEQHGGEVVAVGLGPEGRTKELRKALAKGAHRAVHLCDPAYQGGDATSTARALAAAIAKEDCQLVFTGSQSDDASWGATGSIVAEILGMSHAWLVMGVELEDGGGSLRIVREMEGGMNELLRIPTPAVVEVQAGINHPRYATMRGIMQAKRKPLATPSPADLGLDAADLGASGAAVEIVSVAFPDSGAGATMLEGSPEEAARALVNKLDESGVL